MAKRLISCDASDIAKMTGQELKQAIRASEGRVICTEVIGVRQPVLGDVTNAEVVSAYGSDMILFNGFDVYDPIILGLPEETTNPVATVKRFTGKPVGLNLEPVDLNAKMEEDLILIPAGRTCSAETLKKAEELGMDYVCLTGNPGTGVSNKEIIKAVQLAKQNFSGLIIAGKMHGAGVAEPVVSVVTAEAIVAAGADVLLVPAVGTVPGFTDEDLIKVVKVAKASGALVMSTIGTSQESSSVAVIEQLAIRNKICGVDIQHIGDAGMSPGMANVENIYALSVAIRGMRHTMSRISRSPLR